MWFIAFTLLPFAGLAYACWHVFNILPCPAGWRWLAVAIAVVSMLSIFLDLSRTIEKLPLSLSSVVYEIGTSSIFILLYLVMIFLVLDIGRLARLVPKAWLYGNAWTAAAIFILTAAIFVYGNIHYNNKVRRELSVTTSKPLQKDLKIVMLSDMHLGYHNRRPELARWIDLINAERPDLVLIGGDIIDISTRPLLANNMAEEFRRLKAPVFACLGNHEYYAGEPDAQRFYDEAGIRLLRDATATACGITLIGRDDRTNPHRQNLQKLVRRADLDRFTILLDHQPYFLEQAERCKIDFQFSGHTHRGQVWPISWITESLYECAFGSHRRGATQYYVSSGMGIWGGKFRIGTCSEYVVLTLKSRK